MVRRAFGDVVHPIGFERVDDGTKKGVYRVHLAPTTGHGDSAPASVIVYSWAADENFWPEQTPDNSPDPQDPFGPASGLHRFLQSRAILEDLGIRTLHLYLADDSRQQHPGDTAVVEDVPGPNLERLYTLDAQRAHTATVDLAANLRRMHSHRAPRFGTLEHLRTGVRPTAQACHHVVLEHALGDLTDAAAREPRIAAAGDRITARLHTLHARIGARDDHRLIHGELGPDHVLVTPDDQAVLIDIEGLMFFDVEWEHVFLELRFQQHYRLLAADCPVALDPHRMSLYRLAIRLSLVAGPLRLLEGDFPDREFMQFVAESNTRAALALIED